MHCVKKSLRDPIIVAGLITSTTYIHDRPFRFISSFSLYVRDILERVTKNSCAYSNNYLPDQYKTITYFGLCKQYLWFRATKMGLTDVLCGHFWYGSNPNCLPLLGKKKGRQGQMTNGQKYSCSDCLSCKKKEAFRDVSSQSNMYVCRFG